MVKSFKTNILTWLKTKTYIKTEIDNLLNRKSDTNHTHTNASTTTPGFLSAEDKTKLNNLKQITVDSTINATSTNPVQNKVVNSALNGKANSSHKHPGLDGIQDIDVRGEGTQNTAGYRKAFRLKIEGQYFDAPISFEFVQRMSRQTGRVHIVFNSVKGSTDPSLKNFTYEGRIDQPVYLYKESAGTWVFIIKEQSTYETVNIRFLPLCTNIRNFCTITPLNEYLGSLPTENIQVCSMITATSATAGYMSSSDKSKLDRIAEGATKITVDSSLSSTSINPVQNKVINNALSGKANSSHTHSIGDVTNLQSKLNTIPTLMSSTITVSGTNNEGTITFYKFGKIVVMELNLSKVNLTSTWNVVGTVPSGYMPKMSDGAGSPMVWWSVQGQQGQSAQLNIKSTAEIRFAYGNGETPSLNTYVTYIVD